MSDIAKLKELIHPNAIIQPLSIEYGRKRYELREPKEPSSVIWITGVPQNSLVFNLDDFFPEPDRIFAGTQNECCRADFVLVSSDNGSKQMIFIEMKSDDDKDYAHIRDQLRGACSFMGYCQNIFNSFWNYSFPLSEYAQHYVACTRTSRQWHNKYDNQAPSNTSPNTMLKLEGSNTFQYNRLIARKPR